MTFEELWNSPLSVLAAGAAGGLARVMFAPPSDRRLMIAHIFVGALIALFGAPAIVEHYFGADTLETRRAVALLVGAIGPNAVEIAIRLRVKVAAGDKPTEAPSGSYKINAELEVEDPSCGGAVTLNFRRRPSPAIRPVWCSKTAIKCRGDFLDTVYAA